MITTVFITRHSKPIDRNKIENNIKLSEQESNERMILSPEGEKRAEKLSKLDCLSNVEVLYSSHYTRTLSTAKYIGERLNLVINVDKRFGERKFGIDAFHPLPEDFFTKQWSNFNFKNGRGESINTVTKRTNEALNEILEKHEGKTIMIVGHGTALSAILRNHLEIKRNDEKHVLELYFEGKMIFSGLWDAPELFKLEFENKKLISIENIVYDKD